MRNFKRLIDKKNELGQKGEYILERARILFAKFGLKKTTVDDVARDARVAKGTIYNYFSSKEELFSKVVKRESNIIIEKIEDNVKQQNNVRDKIKIFVITKIKYFKEAFVFYQIEQNIIDEIYPELEKLRQDYFKEEKRIMKDIITYGIKGGSIKKDVDVDVITDTIILALKEMERPWTLEKSIEEVERILDFLLNVLFYGIAEK